MFEWIVPPEQAFPELFDAYAKAIYAGLLAIAERRSPEIEAWMKSNAVWQDRTGNARQSLHSEVEHTLREIAVTMEHGVSYGFWLEVAHQGRYQIIGPALDTWAQILWNDVLELLR